MTSSLTTDEDEMREKMQNMSADEARLYLKRHGRETLQDADYS